jgi:formate dehydrogenase maturation protein FdhE
MASTRSIMRVVDPSSSLMECPVCGHMHWAMIVHGGKYRRGARLCPNGCTRDDLKALSKAE